MENEFFLNAGIAPLIHMESSNPMRSWQQVVNPMELNCSSDRSPDCFHNPTWEKSTDQQGMHFDSALSSMVSSPVASNSNISNESFVIPELIGKLGNIGNNSNGSSAEISLAAAAAAHHHYSNSASTSCYSTPLNSPPKMPLSLNSAVPEFAADPGFAERAARFSCFGSRSFNSRTSQPDLTNGEYNNNKHNNSNTGGSNSNPLGNCKLSRVSSSPSLKALGISQMNNSPLKDRTAANSLDESTVSEQNPNGEKAVKPSNEMNSRKRKVASKGKAKELVLPSSSPSTKVEANDNSNAKRGKTAVEGEGNEKGSQAKTEEETRGNATTGDEKQSKTSPKPPEPPKDYIHVRARRGQATDSHSLAERVRREKISERMKLLQDLVPGCNKVTGKALMLDEIINYVQSLQRQVEFLSMKLSSVNTRLDANIDTLMSKDMFQPNSSMAHPIFPLDSSAQAVYGHQPQQNQAFHSNISNGSMTHCSMDPLETALCQNLTMQLPHLNGFSDIVSQYPAFGEDDLQAIVQMGFGQNQNREASLQPQRLHGPNQVSHMKVEL